MRKLYLRFIVMVFVMIVSMIGGLVACSESSPPEEEAVDFSLDEFETQVTESNITNTSNQDFSDENVNNDEVNSKQAFDLAQLAARQSQDSEDDVDAVTNKTKDSDVTREPIVLSEAAKPLTLKLVSESGYRDAEGVLVLDIMEQDSLEVQLMVLDANGRPVQNAKPSINMNGDSEVISVDGFALETDETGSTRFVLVGGSMGEQELMVKVNNAHTQALLNIISLAASGYDNLADIEGVLPWDVLMEAKISWGEKMSVTFPQRVEEQNGKTVKLAGFMMPLDLSEEQSHFVFTSNPPSCFFHIPGGPAGAVEVFAAEPITTVWAPVIIEGRFEALSESDSGVPYRLHDAKLLDWPE